MRAVVQRVSQAKVSVSGEVVGQIQLGFLILFGVAVEDTDQDRAWLVQKISRLRVFPDRDKAMNLDLQAVSGSILLISQFTLLADCQKGNRPSFSQAALPEVAKAHYEQAIIDFRGQGFVVETGIFGADMAVELVNSGPVTIFLDSRNR